MDNKILIIDDDTSVRETVTVMLEASGYQCEDAASGPEGIEILKGGFCGLVLLDVMMPEMDGWQTMAEIVAQGLNEHVLVCMLTAVVDPGEQMSYLAQYILDYVRKPFTMRELLGAVENAMELLVMQE